MKTTFIRFISALLLLFAARNAHAQGSFVQGDYVDVGVASTGAFGSCTVPAGYHPNVFQVCGGSYVYVLGFVSDPDKDGWSVASPGRANYMGDYFVPGSPYEGWDLQYTTTGSTVARYRNDASGGTCPAGWTCGHTGTVVTPLDQTTTWQGSSADLRVTQKTVVKKEKLYFVVYVDVENIGSTNVSNIYYFRGLDPDNDQPWTGGGFNTDNRIVFQPNSISRNCLVTANGRGYPDQAYLGLGTKDCRARCCIFTNANWPFFGQPSQVYSQSGAAAPAAGYYYNVGDVTLNQDWAIGLVFNLGTLSPGQKTSLAFTYILKQSDLDSALGETSPRFESGGSPYSPYSTFRVCPGKTVDLKVINGGQYKWIWTTPSFPNYMSVTGGSTLVPPGGTIPTVTGSVTYPYGAVYGDSLTVTVWGPKTYTAMGISNCDTQYLVFYVDTISFSVPPSVVSPVRYCEGATATPLSATPAVGATLNWYTVPTGGSSVPRPTPSTAYTGISGTDFDTTNYYVSQTNSAGCETPRARIQVIVTKKPSTPSVNDRVYCIWQPTEQLSATGTNLKWYDAAAGGSRYALPPTPLNTSAGVQSFWVTQTVNGCESDRKQLDVEISEAKAAFVKSDDSLCGPEVLKLTNNSTTSSAGSYTSVWSFGDGTGATDSNTAHSYADKRGTYTVNLKVTNVHGCKDSTKQTVEVFPVPVISVTSDTTRICQGDAVNFTGKATEGYRSLYWDFGDGDPAYGSLQVRHSFTKGGIFNVQLKGTYPACPEVSAGLNIESVSLPNINLGEDVSFCPGSNPLVLRNLNNIPVDHYSWNTGDSTPSLRVSTPGIYALRAQNWKCSSADTVEVRKGCYLDIPNAFNPGSGNGSSGYFLPRNLLSESVTTFSMMVFDRWGQLIFESDKLDGKGWDGTYKGQPMPLGVYVYIIRVSFANGISERYDGNVTLMR
ncbi:PKD domain-containing protein [Rurimicrobium arvi]|uniref:PKD domain-containing protein n=1 Tax=Rurimicrobium arvi TaxID=2049916 RepID=A0ABP8MP14_9BACT